MLVRRGKGESHKRAGRKQCKAMQSRIRRIIVQGAKEREKGK